MGEYVFSRCKKLQAATVPDKVKRLKCGTFSGCTEIGCEISEVHVEE